MYRACKAMSETCMTCLVDKKGNKSNFAKRRVLSMFKPEIEGHSYDEATSEEKGKLIKVRGRFYRATKSSAKTSTCHGCDLNSLCLSDHAYEIAESEEKSGVDCAKDRHIYLEVCPCKK